MKPALKTLRHPLAVCLLVITLGMPALGMAATSHRPAGHTSPKSLVLTLKDLPHRQGWHEAGGIQPNTFVAVAERVTPATINRYRITGYGTSLFRKSRGSGIVSIGDSVGLYKNAGAARWQYKKFTEVNRLPARTKKLDVTGLGDQARGYGASSSRFGVASIYFRRGIFTARLDIASLGPMSFGDVLRLARILDQRMKAAD